MEGKAPPSDSRVRFALLTALAAGLAVGLLAAAIQRSVPVGIFVAVRAAALSLAAGIAAALVGYAVVARPPMRKRRFDESSHRELATAAGWWSIAGLAFTILAAAAWRGWVIIFVVLAVSCFTRAYSAFSYIKNEYEFRNWMPLAGLIVAMTITGLLLIFLVQTRLPPTIAAARRSGTRLQTT